MKSFLAQKRNKIEISCLGAFFFEFLKQVCGNGNETNCGMPETNRVGKIFQEGGRGHGRQGGGGEDRPIDRIFLWGREGGQGLQGGFKIVGWREGKETDLKPDKGTAWAHMDRRLMTLMGGKGTSPLTPSSSLIEKEMRKI